MLHIHHLCVLDTRFEHSKFQNIACLRIKNELTGLNGLTELVLTNFLFQFFFDSLCVDTELLEQIEHRGVLLTENAEQEVFRTYRTAGQACRLFPAESKDLRYFW